MNDLFIYNHVKNQFDPLKFESIDMLIMVSQVTMVVCSKDNEARIKAYEKITRQDSHGSKFIYLGTRLPVLETLPTSVNLLTDYDGTMYVHNNEPEVRPAIVKPRNKLFK